MQTVMSHNFSQIPQAQIPRSNFKRTMGYKTTFDSGYLIPVYVDEALPGDTFNMNLTFFARLATPIAPIMDNMFLDMFFFFVPNRLLWENWERMNGAQDKPGDSTDFLCPQVACRAGGYLENSMSDYFGIPTKQDGLDVTAFHHRAYNKIYNEWFRDENLQDPVPENLGDGPDACTDYEIKKRAKRHDYFTSCLPWPQKAVAVDLPLGTTAPLLNQAGVSIVGDQTATPVLAQNDLWSSVAAQLTNSAQSAPLQLDITAHTLADLSQATAASINDIREAFAIQKLYERDARGGTRYTEMIQSHFGVTSPDQRLQRPEYLGGGSYPIQINQVAQTSSTDATTPQGNLSAYGTASGTRCGFTKSFVEHGVILGIASVRADLTYQQGVHKMFSRRDRFDFYYPSLSHIGEQAVLHKEIYYDGALTDNEDVFGYQAAWDEYRYGMSKITGLFRSNATGTLDFWHLSQNFSSRPTLGSDFIEENPPIDRVIAVTTEPQFIYDSYIDLNCARPMPSYGVPGLIDHF